MCCRWKTSSGLSNRRPGSCPEGAGTAACIMPTTWFTVCGEAEEKMPSWKRPCRPEPAQPHASFHNFGRAWDPDFDDCPKPSQALLWHLMFRCSTLELDTGNVGQCHIMLRMLLAG